MAKQVRIRRDTLTNLNAVIPADGELAYNLTDDRIHIGDGTSYGGIPHLNFRDELNNKFTYIAAGGTGNAITLTLPYSPGSYTTGLIVRFKATANNTGATTINVNGLGAKNLYKYTAGTLGNIVTGDIINGGMYEAMYDGTQFQLLTLQNAGITTVSQGDLNTSTGSFTINPGMWPSAGTNTTLPGGEYGFYPRIGKNGSSSHSNPSICMLGFQPTTGSLGAACRAAAISTAAGGGSHSPVSGNQRYVTSSPPFDLGDGEAAGFMFLLMRPDGTIDSSYFADVPPWAYNGPTDIRACYKCPKTGKKFRRAMKRRSLEEIMDGASIQYELEEITQAVKNADMNILPQPFDNFDPSYTPILIDPMDDRIRAMIEFQNAGGAEEINNAIERGLIRVDNDILSKRKGPPGVAIHRMQFKYSGGKAKA